MFISFQKKLADFGKILPTNDIGAPLGAAVFEQLKRLQFFKFLKFALCLKAEGFLEFRFSFHVKLEAKFYDECSDVDKDGGHNLGGDTESRQVLTSRR